MQQKFLVVLATLAVLVAGTYGIATAADANKIMATTTAPSDSKLAPETVIANVNGVAIKGAELLEIKNTMRAPANQMPVDLIFGQLQERLIDGQLVLQAAQKEKLANDAEVIEKLAKAKERIMQDVYLTRNVGSTITADVVKARYDQMAKEFKPQVELKASHILVATEAEAKAIAEQLLKGGDFAKLAKEKSTDQGSASNGGDLGFFAADQVVEPFAKAAFALKDGETSAPVQSQFGWHIIKAESRRDTKMPELDAVRGEIQRVIADEKLAALFLNLRKDAKIEKFGMDGKPVVAQADPNASMTPPSAADKKTQ